MLASSHVVGPEQGSDAIFRLLDLALVWNLPEEGDPRSRTLQGVEPGSEAANQKMLTRTLGSAKQIPLARGVWQRADLAELADWVEGLRAAAQKAREDGNPTLADALDITRFEVYEGYLDEELHQQSQPSS
jgi:hypothetical protein